jgi:excisionase family DNA binding protein
MPSDALLLDLSTAAATLAVSRSTLYRLLDAGELPSVTVGRSRRITRASLVAYVAEREGVALATAAGDGAQ